MGEIFRFKNLRFKLRAQDYVHVYGPDSFAKVNIESLEITYAHGFSKSDLKIIQQQIFKRKIKILDKWEMIHGKN